MVVLLVEVIAVVWCWVLESIVHVADGWELERGVAWVACVAWLLSLSGGGGCSQGIICWGSGVIRVLKLLLLLLLLKIIQRS